ncbi:hypothetical protein HAX54_044232 [Datura stramonium]|uniref:Uncharacterized protein n=1 Tax=Datura stramonium TaxID=4076 RepID=A0ABS8SP99_DATST|nr:hypothetical protein [Datura stramonium]
MKWGYQAEKSVSFHNLPFNRQRNQVIDRKNNNNNNNGSGGDGGDGKSSIRKSKSKDAAVTHAVAERKRRERINSHLHTLKKLFPYLPKNVDCVNYFHVKTSAGVARVIKDYLGVLNEDSLRKNFVLVYELLDEVIDFGYVQTTSTEILKSYIFNEPIMVDAGRLPPLGPAAMFMQYDGMIKYVLICYIESETNKRRTMGLAGSGAVILDDCNFHESVHLDSFDVDRTELWFLRMVNFLSWIPDNPGIQASISVSFELEPGAVGQTTDFKESSKRLEWSLKKVLGGSDHTLRAKLTFSQESHGNITKEAGPVSMTFTIPMYNPSRLQVKYLQIAKKSKTYNPYRWVRYVTQANSYVARI